MSDTAADTDNMPPEIRRGCTRPFRMSFGVKHLYCRKCWRWWPEDCFYKIRDGRKSPHGPCKTCHIKITTVHKINQRLRELRWRERLAEIQANAGANTPAAKAVQP